MGVADNTLGVPPRATPRKGHVVTEHSISLKMVGNTGALEPHHLYWMTVVVVNDPWLQWATKFTQLNHRGHTERR